MRPYFASQTLPVVLFGCTLAVWILFELRQAFRRRPEASSRDRGSLLIVRISVGVGLVAAALAPGRVPGASIPEAAVLFGTGIVLMWCGVALRIWSFKTLGRYFTFTVMTSSDQPVITYGPYRFVRHPSYSGIILTLIGLGATYGNWVSLAALALIPPIGFIYRIRVEEAALAATLGNAYTAYASRRKRLVPFIW